MSGSIQFTLRSLFYVMCVAACFFALTGWFGLEYVGTIAVLMAPGWIPLLLWRATTEEVKSCLKLSLILVIPALFVSLALNAAAGVFLGAVWITLSIWAYWGQREVWRLVAWRRLTHRPAP